MDCFYAAVETRDQPQLRGKPVAVGGHSSGRGVLTTANYEARKFGCRSAMPTATALRQCPDLVLVPVNMSKYREESKEIHKILRRYTDLIEPLSLDEAYLDVSSSGRLATEIAQEIRQAIRQERQLTASAGISINKFIAKIASDWNKPDGQFVVKPHQVDQFVAELRVGKLFGVGKVTESKLHAFGVRTCVDLRAHSEEELQARFGKFGGRLYQLCRGIDHRPVSVKRQRKSLSVERTYANDWGTLQELQQCLPELLEDLEKRWETNRTGYAFKGITLKVKFHDFDLTTVSRSTQYEWDQARLADEFTELLEIAWHRRAAPVRLLGIGLQTVPRQAQSDSSPQIPML